MLYNQSTLHLPKSTAGRITVFTAFIGLAVFSVVFLFNLGSNELQKAEAQNTATTSITVLNTPPAWLVDAQETSESSTTTPTNSGDTVSWDGTATDANGADYFLLICSGTSTPTEPTPNSGAAPTCANNQVQWGVSGATNSGVEAVVSTTTTEAAPFAESNDWYAWICDGDAVSPRCNSDFKEGTATTASPFAVNSRPTFTLHTNDGPADPGQDIVFTTTSSDADVDGTADTVQLVVCATTSYNGVTNQCDGTTLATSTLVAANATGTYTVVIPTQDQAYSAFGHIFDNHGHEAVGGQQGVDTPFIVNNVAPTVNPGDIDLNGGLDLVLTQEAAETPGFTLEYDVTDNNSCVNAGATDEVVDYEVSVFRSGIGTTSCEASNSAHYDPNNCYVNSVPTTTWNLVCTASSTTCSGPTDDVQTWECSFPLWYISDPTDATTTTVQFEADDWRAGVRPVDDNNASSSVLEQSSFAGIEVVSFLAFALDTLSIAYTDLEPGQFTDPLAATTTVRATGNVGLDERLTGESMCGTYSVSNECQNSATSTINDDQQVFATSSVAYATASGTGNTLSSTTDKELEVNIFKSTATSSQASGLTFWGIRVPSSITLAGLYTGRNTFIGVVGESAQWGP